eukprot:GHRQ01014145.1.p1 GENE.GHRQ01014145.1~~GHRQ01014145.1.p1  ORF type:complete len:202 (+),score=25.78 GHRQ01014145.1:970-1575(+)
MRAVASRCAAQLTDVTSTKLNTLLAACSTLQQPLLRHGSNHGPCPGSRPPQQFGSSTCSTPRRTRCSASLHLRLCTLPLTSGTLALWLNVMLPWSRNTITRTLASLGGVRSCGTWRDMTRVTHNEPGFHQLQLRRIGTDTRSILDSIHGRLFLTGLICSMPVLMRGRLMECVLQAPVLATRLHNSRLELPKLHEMGPGCLP